MEMGDGVPLRLQSRLPGKTIQSSKYAGKLNNFKP